MSVCDTCDECGTRLDPFVSTETFKHEATPDVLLHTAERCLQQQLREAIAKKVAVEGEFAELKTDFDSLLVMWANVSGALCDAKNVVIYERDYARSVRALTAVRDGALHTIADYEQVLLTCGMLPRAKSFHKEQAEMRAVEPRR